MTHRSFTRTSLQAAAGALLAVGVLAACNVNMMPTKDVWYTQHYSIMQDFERNAYRTLSEAGKKEFQNLFWAVRDPKSKEIFQERMSYVMNAFKRENARQPWNTDRARIYLLNGPPAVIDFDQNTSWGIQLGQPVTGAVDRSNEDVGANRAELWTYAFQKQYIAYRFTFAAPNEWRMSPARVSGSKYLGDLENYNKTVVFGIRDTEEYRQRIEALEKKK